MTYDNLDLAAMRTRRNVKWSNVEPDQIPLWIAEMDFPVANVITDGLTEFLLHGGAGYPAGAVIESQREALVNWYRDSTGSAVDRSRLIEVPSVLTGLEILVRQRVPEDSAVIVPVPAYMPFLQILGWLGRRIIPVPMLAPTAPGESYRYDLDGIDRAFGDGGKLLIICNPHNPTGALLSEAEAAALGEIVDRHCGIVFSDEIHVPLRYADSPAFVGYGSVSETHASHTYTALSASKGWNIPGLKCASVIAPSPEAVAQMATAKPEPSSPGLLATDLAFRHGGPWLTETTAYLRGNIDVFSEFMERVFPEASYAPPQATYLGWANLSALRPESPETVAAYLADEARVVVSNGADCGAPGFVRVNLATSRPVLEEALQRVERIVTR